MERGGGGGGGWRESPVGGGDCHIVKMKIDIFIIVEGHIHTHTNLSPRFKGSTPT